MTSTAAALAQRLSRMVQVATVTPPEGELSPEKAEVFAELKGLLYELYPTVFATAEVTGVGRAGMLLRVAGTLRQAQGAEGQAQALRQAQGAEGQAQALRQAQGAGVTGLGDVLLMAHQDVVPAPSEGWAEAGWTHAPFAGTVADGEDGLTVYGRGTLDDKGSLLVLLEAVEDLLASGWRPHHDLYLELGADEELDGPSAVAAVDELARRGVVPAFVLDEGGAVTTGLVPGLTSQVAVVGVAEKGVTTLELSVSADPRKPAHSSTPPRRGATAGLGRAIAALERHPHPAAVDDISVRMFSDLAPYVRGPLSQVLARTERLRTVLARVLPMAGPELAAMVRTTTCATMLTGSAAPNIIAAKATAIINMRVATSSTVAEATRHVEKVVTRAVGRGLTAEVRVVEGHEPTPASPFDERWEAIRTAVSAAYPDTVTVPYTMLGASDARHVARLTDAVYRFSPLFMSTAQRAGVHGVDERVSADSLVRGVRFYRSLLEG